MSTTIKAARHAASLTQSQLAEASGINIRQIQKYESGEYDAGNMTLRTAAALAGALKIGIADLLN